MVDAFGFHEAAAGGVKVEEFGVAAPADGGFELANGLFFGELLVEYVVEELLGDFAIALGLDGLDDLAQQQDAFERRFAEDFLLVEDLGVGVFVAEIGDGGVALVDGEEAEHLRGFHDGEQVVDLEGEFVGEAVDVILAALIDEQLEQTGDAAGRACGSIW